jgi:hypothetical protein
MISENPYASPYAALTEPILKTQLIQFISRKQAIVAGLKKGAKFGGKLMGIISLAFAILGWLFFVLMFLYAWLWKGVDFGYLLEKIELIELLKKIGETLFLILYLSFIGALAGAVVTGIAGGISFRLPIENTDEKLPQDSNLPVTSGIEG